MELKINDNVEWWTTIWGSQKRKMHGVVLAMSEDGKHARVYSGWGSVPVSTIEVKRLKVVEDVRTNN